MKNNKLNFSKSKKAYIALILCVSAVSAVGWSTYKNVNNFIEPKKSQKNNSDEISEKKKKSLKKEQKAKDLNKNNILEKDESKDNNLKVLGDAESYEDKKLEQNDNEELQSVSAKVAKSPVIYPVSKSVIKEFSGDTLVYSKTFSDWRTHQGTDFKADEGTKVKSISDGVVKDVYKDGAYGTTVSVDYDKNITAYYCGLADITSVSKGKKVKLGEEIGAVKSVPCEVLDEPHLHFMISRDEKFIDPMTIFENGIN